MYYLVQSGSGGILEITVQYQALLHGAQLDLEESHKKTHINMSVGILRATGLKVHNPCLIYTRSVHIVRSF